MICVIHSMDHESESRNPRRELFAQGIRDFTIIPPFMQEKRPHIGISKSHKECVKYAKTMGWPFVIIMEDDVKFLEKTAFNQWFENRKNLPEGWEIYLAGAFGFKKPKEQPVNNLVKVDNVTGFHCYMVNASFFDRFLTAEENAHIDRWATSKGGLNASTYLHYPVLASQHDGYSFNSRRVLTHGNKL